MTLHARRRVVSDWARGALIVLLRDAGVSSATEAATALHLLGEGVRPDGAGS